MKRLVYDLTEIEVERAKNCQSMLVTSNLMRQVERIDEIARNIYVLDFAIVPNPQVL